MLFFISKRFFLITISLPNFVHGRKPSIYSQSSSLNLRLFPTTFCDRLIPRGFFFFFFFWWYNTELDSNFLCPYCDHQSHSSQALDKRRLYTLRKHRSILAKIASLPSPDRPLRGTVWGIRLLLLTTTIHLAISYIENPPSLEQGYPAAQKDLQT